MKEYRIRTETSLGATMEVLVVVGTHPAHGVRIYPSAGWTNTGWAPVWSQGYDRIPESCSKEELAAAKEAVKKVLGRRVGARHWDAYMRAHAAY